MDEKDIQVFINCVTSYFSQISGVEAITGIPYRKGDESVLLNFTGIIGVSGERKGCVYITCTQEMLTEIIGLLLEDDSPSEVAIKDLAGEMANTIAGNAREVFGTGFMISVPIILNGKPRDVEIPLEVPTYVIPITWKTHQSFLVVGIM